MGKKLLLAICCALALCGGGTRAQSQDEKRWYLWHLKSETCVPLDDVGEDWGRLYYGAGAMHTPRDFERFLKRGGFTITKRVSDPLHYGYWIRSDTNNNLEAHLFSNPGLCKAMMELIDKAGLQ
jgi:hypothetical protein